MEKNDRKNKTFLLLLGNNHYVYVTKYNLLSKYVKDN